MLGTPDFHSLIRTTHSTRSRRASALKKWSVSYHFTSFGSLAA